MKSLSLATLSLTFLLAVSSAAQAQNPAPAPAATAQAKPAAPVATPAPQPASPAPTASAAPVTSPAPTAKKPTDLEAQPLTGYVAPAASVTPPGALLADIGVKLGGVIGLMALSALGWRTLRRRGISPLKSATAERNEARLSVVEKMHLSPQQVLYVVRYAERVLLVGSSQQNMSLITELTRGAVASAATATASLPAPVSEALREIETRNERVKPSPEPAVRTPRPVATEDRFAGILDRLRAQEEPSVAGEYRVQQARPSRTVAELEEDEEERLLAGASRGGSLFRAAENLGDGRWSR